MKMKKEVVMMWNLWILPLKNKKLKYSSILFQYSLYLHLFIVSSYLTKKISRTVLLDFITLFFFLSLTLSMFDLSKHEMIKNCTNHICALQKLYKKVGLNRGYW